MSTIHINPSSRSAIVSSCSEVFFDDFFSKKAICKNNANGYIQSTSDGFPPCSFTGKEKDEETGYGYFGARYMDHELMTMWLSVDPMADKYPSISPYAYCAWNPVKLVDPDGKDVWEVSEDGHVKRTGDDGGVKKQTINYANGETATFSGEQYHSILSDLTSEKKTKLTNGKQANLSQSEGTVKKKSAMGNLFLSLADNTNVEWSLHKFKDGKYAISTLHETECSASPQTIGKNMSDLLTMIHSHPGAEPNKREELSSMGYLTQDGTYSTFYGNAPNSDYSVRYYCYPENINYYVYMKKSHTIYSMDKGKWPLNKGKITKSSQLPW